MKERSHTDYGLEDFESGKKNILFITGYFASGKSSLAREYSKKYNALNIELDLIHSNFLNNACDPEFLEYEKDAKEFKIFWIPFILKNKLGTIIKIGDKSKMVLNGSYSSLSIPARVKLVIDFAKSLNKPCILEGVQCYLYQDLWNEILNYPVIIMDTSILKSRISNDKRAGKLQLNNFIYLNRYYSRQVLLLKHFKKELERKYNIMDKMLESYIIITESDHDIFDADIVEEGIFFDDKKTTPGFDEKMRDTKLVNFYVTGKNKGFSVPSKLWPKGFVKANATGGTYASEGMIKNGPRVIAEYVNAIEKSLCIC